MLIQNKVNSEERKKKKKKRKEKKNRTNDKRYNILVVHLNPNIPITTLSVNAVTIPIKGNITVFLNSVMPRRDKSLNTEKS